MDLLSSYMYRPTCTCREVRQAGWGACIVWKFAMEFLLWKMI